MPSITDQEYKQGYKIIGSDVVDKGGKVVRSDTAAPGNNAPATQGAETPAGTLPSGSATSDTGGSIFDYQTVIRQALNEATTARKSQQMGAVAPFTAGLPNNALTSVIDSIKKGANLDATGTYKSFLDSQQAEQDNLIKKQQLGIDYLKAVGDGIGSMDDQAILALSKTTGIDSSQLLALRIAGKQKDADAHAKVMADIEQSKASAAASNRSNRGNSTSNAAFVFTADDKRRLLGSGLTTGEITNIEENLKKGNSIDAVLAASTLSDSEKKVVKDTMTNISGAQTEKQQVASEQFLSSEWFWQNYTREQLMKSAKDQGLVSGGVFNKQGNPDAYIAAMMAQIKRDRTSGMSDKDIYAKLLGK